jgi:hypothetical protein
MAVAAEGLTKRGSAMKRHSQMCIVLLPKQSTDCKTLIILQHPNVYDGNRAWKRYFHTSFSRINWYMKRWALQERKYEELISVHPGRFQEQHADTNKSHFRELVH